MTYHFRSRVGHDIVSIVGDTMTTSPGRSKVNRPSNSFVVFGMHRCMVSMMYGLPPACMNIVVGRRLDDCRIQIRSEGLEKWSILYMVCV